MPRGVRLLAIVVWSMLAAFSVGVRGQRLTDPPAITYASIDGQHLKTYVDALTAMSRRYRDNGHPQFWDGSSARRPENARWLLERFKAIGLSDVREQPFDLPPRGCRSRGA